MKLTRALLSLVLAVLLMSALLDPAEKQSKDDGRLHVSCRNVPDEVDPKNIEFKLFLNEVQIMKEKDFLGKDHGLIENAEDSYWPAALYDTQISGLFDFKVLVKDVEIREGVFTFLTYDYEVLDSMRLNSEIDEAMIIEWKSIAPSVWRTNCSIKQE